MVLSPVQVLLRANLLFWSFLVLSAVAAFLVGGAVWDDALKGLWKFLFLALGGGFTLVTVMDYIDSRRSQGREG
jgi:hypothetical protein